VTSLQAIKDDPYAWSETYSLPIFPAHLNPWIYMAYALKCCPDLTAEELTHLQGHAIKFYEDSWVAKDYPARRPDKLDQTFSHDEVKGLIYCFMFLGLKPYAEDFFHALNKRMGFYNVNTIKPRGLISFFRWNVYRSPSLYFECRMAIYGKLGCFGWAVIFPALILMGLFPGSGVSDDLRFHLFDSIYSRHRSLAWAVRFCQRRLVPFSDALLLEPRSEVLHELAKKLP